MYSKCAAKYSKSLMVATECAIVSILADVICVNLCCRAPNVAHSIGNRLWLVGNALNLAVAHRDLGAGQVCRVSW